MTFHTPKWSPYVLVAKYIYISRNFTVVCVLLIFKTFLKIFLKCWVGKSFSKLSWRLMRPELHLSSIIFSFNCILYVHFLIHNNYRYFIFIFEQSYEFGNHYLSFIFMFSFFSILFISVTLFLHLYNYSFHTFILLYTSVYLFTLIQVYSIQKSTH